MNPDFETAATHAVAVATLLTKLRDAHDRGVSYTLTREESALLAQLAQDMWDFNRAPELDTDWFAEAVRKSLVDPAWQSREGQDR